MYCIELMKEEHKNIKRMLGVIRKRCYKILKNEETQYEDFFAIIDFIRNYADNHHHGKEETMLFNKMASELGSAAKKLVNHGMHVEHDMGRLYTSQLETAVNKVLNGDDEARLDVIANAISYAHLLDRHIDKEDKVVYEYARKNLGKDILDKINLECQTFEEKAKSNGVQQKYLDLIDELESKA